MDGFAEAYKQLASSSIAMQDNAVFKPYNNSQHHQINQAGCFSETFLSPPTLNPNHRKMTKLSALLLGALALHFTSTLADFQIANYVTQGGPTYTVAIAQGEMGTYSKKCFAAQVTNGGQSALIDGTKKVDSNTGSFSIKSGLCGAAKMDVYKQGGQWNIYKSGGDGSVQAQCYTTNGGNSCSTDGDTDITLDQVLYCHSYLCK
jgi:hypothetical protein